MTRVFIDTGAFVAKENPRDQHHKVAVAAWATLADLPVRWVSTEHVLAESATLLARDTSYRFAAAWTSDIIQSPEFEWLPTAPGDRAAAAKLMGKFADQTVSFVDCLSFAVLQRLRIRHAYTFDRHFSYAGFVAFPERQIDL
jgi:predicted nucleic acid-binding protein